MNAWKKCLLVSVLLAAAPATALAADTVKIVVPFAAGGPVDMVGRVLQPGLAAALNKTVIIDNRGGVGGTIGAGFVAKSAPDGLTLLLASSSFVMAAGTVANIPYDPRKELEPIVMVGEVQTLLVTRNNLEVTSVADLIAKGKAGAKYSYGSSGIGSTMHIGVEMLNSAYGTHFTHVPYRGAGPALTDLMAGTIDFLNADVPVLAPYVKDNRLKALVIFDTKRSPKLPNVPSNIEAGVPQLQMTNWYGIFAPAGTPPAVRAQLESAILGVANSPDVSSKLSEAGMSKPLNTAAFQARVNQDFERWIPFIKKAGIHAD
ncbi:MAG TPA: tripartite tricarboxylate transporter substrate binding protein [Burkholderiales bacterium]|nr:tripartite tricarboxylate transporter substrate binding protein [Burkholderiales bacterium]